MHRRITLTRVAQEPSMLSPSPSKIRDLAIPGASPRPTDLAAPAKTAKHEGTEELAGPAHDPLQLQPCRRARRRRLTLMIANACSGWHGLTFGMRCESR